MHVIRFTIPARGDNEHAFCVETGDVGKAVAGVVEANPLVFRPKPHPNDHPIRVGEVKRRSGSDDYDVTLWIPHMLYTRVSFAPVRFPSGSEFDSLGMASGGSVRVTLDPRGERPEVKTYRMYGAGIPAPCYHNLELTLCTYGPGIDGDEIRARLMDKEEHILRLAAGWEGARWDGHNHVGRWSDDAWNDDEFEGIAEGCGTYEG